MKFKSVFAELKDYLILWASQTVSSLGTSMTNYVLLIWVFDRGGSASSVTTLSLCAYLPTILFRFIAGAIADRWDKKRIMLISDLCAAAGSLSILVLFRADQLVLWHLYAIKFLLSFMSAFQTPASQVAVSLLVPKEHYARVGGLQSMAGSVVSIIAAPLGSILYAAGGMELVLTVDLATFAAAFVTLWLFIRMPEIPKTVKDDESILHKCLSGLAFLRERRALLQLILFFTVINFFAKLGGDGLMSAFILGRTGSDHAALAAVSMAVTVGTLSGSALITVMKPVKSRVRAIYVSCGLTFLIGNVGLALGRSVPVWCIAAGTSYLFAAILNVHLGTLMRESVPIEMQGRVFSAQATLQNISIPLGLWFGGVLADYAFEPLMAGESALALRLACFFGEGVGSGIGVQFFLVGFIGGIISFVCLKMGLCRDSDEKKA